MTTLALVVTALVSLAGPGGGPPPKPGDIGGATAQQLQARGATVVDVRTPSEYEGGHVPGAISIPYDEIAARGAEVGAKDKPVLLYCRSGRRADLAAATLVKMGFTAVYNFKTVADWPGPLEKGPARGEVVHRESGAGGGGEAPRAAPRASASARRSARRASHPTAAVSTASPTTTPQEPSATPRAAWRGSGSSEPSQA